MIAAIRREPVYLGTAVSVTADGLAVWGGASAAAQGILHGIVLAWVAVFVRSLSTPTVKADEAVAAAKAEGVARVDEAVAGVEEKLEGAKYVGALEHQAVAAAGAALAPPARPARARKAP